VGVTASKDLAHALTFVNPELAPCEVESCGHFPLAELGGVWSTLEDGSLCRHCRQGLVKGVKQRGPYTRCTDLTSVPWLQIEDGSGENKAQPLPTRNDYILECAENPKHWLRIDDRILATLVEEDLLDEEGAPNVAHLIAYLIHVRQISPPVEAYRRLQDRDELNCFTAQALTGLVREAKKWTAGVVIQPAPAAQPMGRVTMRLQANMQPSIYVGDLLKELFDESTLRQFMARYYDAISLPGGNATLATLCWEAASGMNRHGVISEDLFQNLRTHIPTQAANIDYVAGLCGFGTGPSKEQVLSALCRLLNAQFEAIIFLMDAPRSTFSNGSQSQTAIDLVRWAEDNGRMDDLVRETKKKAPGLF